MKIWMMILRAWSNQQGEFGDLEGNERFRVEFDEDGGDMGEDDEEYDDEDLGMDLDGL